MVRQMRDQEGGGGGRGGGGVGGGGSFSLCSRESRGVSLLSYLSEASGAFERGSQTPLSKHSSLHTPTDDELSKSLPEEGGDGDDDSVWQNDPDTSPPSPEETRRDSLLLFQRYSTPDILRQNGGVSPGLETDMESSLNTSQDTDTEVGSQADRQRVPVAPEEPPEPEQEARDPKPPEPSPAQRRAAAQRISTLLGALEAALEEEKGCTETQLADLEKQVQHFNTVLKVSADDTVVCLT